VTAARQLTRPRTPRRVPRRRRRQPYGITAPGTYSTIPAWWSRERWRSECYSDLHLSDVTDLRRAVGGRGPVSVQACWALASALSACADTDTGRNAMPGTAALTADRDTLLDLDDPAVLARLQAATGYGQTTLQKAARVLATRGWIVLIRAGKNWLTIDERKELWRAGSAARQRRNVWACTIPTHLRAPGLQRPPEPVAAPRSAPAAPPSASAPVDNTTPGNPDAESGCDLPTTRRVSGFPSVPENKIFKPEQASRTGATRRPSTKEARPHRTYRADWRTVRLAKDLKARVYWLRDTPHQRIMPSLDRFARAGWHAADIQRELDQMLSARGWEVPSARVSTTATGQEHRYPLRCTWGYLAMLLRTLEPTDLEAQREYDRAMRAAQLEYEQLRRTGPECAHGEPAGDVPSPLKSIQACPLCRRSTVGPCTDGGQPPAAGPDAPG
jgi:hypothetical protein